MKCVRHRGLLYGDTVGYRPNRTKSSDVFRGFVVARITGTLKSLSNPRGVLDNLRYDISPQPYKVSIKNTARNIPSGMVFRVRLLLTERGKYG